jgi:transcriptional regulator with XRE-family HTH domain
MNQTASVATASVRSLTSRRRKNPAIVRAQFEEWLAELGDNDDIDVERGERIRALIERVGTQVSVAKEVDVSPRTVGRWAEGRGISPKYRAGLASALGRSISYVMYGEEDAPEQRTVIARLDAIEAQLDDVLRLLRRLADDEPEAPPDELLQPPSGPQPKPSRGPRGVNRPAADSP